MKGHEDGGNVLGQEEAVPQREAEALSAMILRKEVIQPQVPLRLPCYDFTPVAEPTGLAASLRVSSPPSGQLPWCDGRCVQGLGTYSPRHADPRLLAIRLHALELQRTIRTETAFRD